MAKQKDAASSSPTQSAHSLRTAEVVVATIIVVDIVVASGIAVFPGCGNVLGFSWPFVVVVVGATDIVVAPSIVIAEVRVETVGRWWERALWVH
jgi:hypothetical protein